jgi:hypothetical protein
MKTALGGIATTVEVLMDMDDAFNKDERFEMYGMIKDSALRLRCSDQEKSSLCQS